MLFSPVLTWLCTSAARFMASSCHGLYSPLVVGLLRVPR
jgi:hypothetical protein